MKREIIVDDINVIDCPFIDKFGTCGICDHLIKTNLTFDKKNLEKCEQPAHHSCEWYPNCHYKQATKNMRICIDSINQAQQAQLKVQELDKEIALIKSKAGYCYNYEKDCHLDCEQKSCMIKNGFWYATLLKRIESKILQFWHSNHFNDKNYEKSILREIQDIITTKQESDEIYSKEEIDERLER